MIRKTLALLCALLLLPLFALAEDASRPGQFAALPLLDEETNQAIKSLLSELTLQARRHSSDAVGYIRLDALLQDVSVLDLVMQSQGGVYYEQSNLLAGETVAFTPQAFARFVSRVSAQSAGLLPPALDGVLGVLTQALGGAPLAIDGDTVDGALDALLHWQAEALTSEEALRPVVRLPGLYGVRAEVTEVTREELLTLATLYCELLADNEALWLAAAAAQADTDDELALGAAARRMADLLHALPQTLADLLPEDWPPAQFRVVYDEGGLIVAHQLDVTLSDGGALSLEWVPGDALTSAYAALRLGGSVLEIVLSHDPGAVGGTARIPTAQSRTVAQVMYEEPDLRVDAVITRVRDIESRSEKESITTRTDIVLESEALLGPEAVITITERTTDVAAGARDGYTRRIDTEWSVGGPGFDEGTVLTITTRTKAEKADPPIADLEAALHPALLPQEALDKWLAERQISLLQVGYTILGRLPADVAAYLLTMGQAE